MRIISCFLIFFFPFVFSCSSTKSVDKVKKESLNSEDAKDVTYAFTEATKQQLFGNFSQAVYLYQQCLQDNPRHAPSYYQLSRIFSYSGNATMAVKYAQKACEYDKNNYWYLINLAGIYQNNKKLDSSIFVLKEIVQKFPEKSDIKLQLAMLLTENGKPAESLKLLDELESSFGKTERTAIAKQTDYLMLHQNLKARDELKYLLKVDENNVRYLGLMAELYSDMGKTDSADFYYKKISSIDFGNYLGVMSQLEMYKKLHDSSKIISTLDEVLLNDRVEKEKKLQILRDILYDSTYLSILKGHEKSYIRKYNSQFPNDELFSAMCADYFLNTNNLPDAEVQLQKLLRINPKNYNYWERLGYVENLEGNLDSVLILTQRADTVFPDVSSLDFISGISLFQKNRYEEAIDYFLKALAGKGLQAGRKIQVYSFMTEAYVKLGQFDKAFGFFEKLLDVDSDNIVALNNYSYYLAVRNENLQKAFEMIKRVIEKEPTNSTYLDTYAWVLYKKGDFKEALNVIKKAAKFDNYKSGEILEHYGDILFCNDKKSEAREFWKNAIKLGQDKESLEKKINEFNCQ